eukprot:m.16236 g.16236  ORF g.16236 m.16236 type:complete len:93 (+) comp5625_c0_seq1:25-303(+)
MAHTRMLFVLFSLVVGAQANKPNIVWIMSDDLGAGEVGIFPGGSDHGRISTPNLDKFGQEGMKFMNAYAGYTGVLLSCIAGVLPVYLFSMCA